jgi:hypothetical protein
MLSRGFDEAASLSQCGFGALRANVQHPVVRIVLICVGDPRKGGIRGCFDRLSSFRPVLARGGPAVGVKVERPERSEDERP